MHRTTSSVIAFAATAAAAMQAAALISWHGPADDPARSLAVATATAATAQLPGIATWAVPASPHGSDARSHVAAGEPPCPSP